MSVSLTVNGNSYAYPQVGDTNWGTQATAWASAVTVGMLQKAGGSFPLTAEVDFGATYGAKIAYLKTQTSNISLTGWARLANTTDSISWRNAANSADLALTVNSSNVLSFNGEVVPAGLIVNADVDPAAAIAFSKMAALTVSRLLVSDGSGVVSVSAATSTEAGYLSGVTSAIQTQLDARLPIAGGTMTGDLFLNADPTATNQAATKAYVDNAAAGNVNNFTVRVATTAAVNLANELENGDTIDGVVLATGNLVLVKNQASTAANGIYVVPASGTASRDTSMDTWTEVIGASVFVTAGTANAGTNWKFNTAAGGTLGVTAIPIVQNGASQVYSASGEGIELSGTTFSLELDGTTLSKSGSGLKVNEIANTQIAAAAAIAVNKLAAVTASRALVSDGSGFVSAATTTSTEIGYVNGVTSAIQTQLDAKIAASVMTTNGDLITRAAGVPARIAIGTSGYYLGSNGTAASWVDPKISFTQFLSTSSSLAVPTTYTAFTLAAPTDTAGTPVTRSGNTFTFPFTGIYQIHVNLGGVESTSTNRSITLRLRNTTDGTSLSNTIAMGTENGGYAGQSCYLVGNVTDISKVYELQICASGTNVTLNQETIGGGLTELWKFTIERIRQ